VASDRDRQAVQLRHAGVGYGEITERLGFTDRRAAHRGVARGLAEPAADEAMIRALAQGDMDERLQELERRLLVWLEQAQPRVLETLECRVYFQVMDALFRVSVRRCRLWGLVTHPYRRDVPVHAWWDLHRLSVELEHRARIPPSRLRSAMALKVLAPVLSLRPAAELDVGMECLVPASVRALLAEVA
jgi:hypothetical protein